MAYNYYQPSGYVPMYAANYNQMQGQQMQTPQPNPAASNAGMIWVDGYNEAAMYPVAPNAAVALWDKSAASIYLKKADATGRPSIQIFDLVERKEAPQAASDAQGGVYATKAALASVESTVEEIKHSLDEMRLKMANKAADEFAEEK